MSPRWKAVLVLAGMSLAGLLAGPTLIREYWTWRSGNPVRRGVARARELGCFSCHGNLGNQGIRDPGRPGEEVPAWDGGLHMMYVENDEDIRRFILDGSVPKSPGSDRRAAVPAFPGEESPRPPASAVVMPPFRESLHGSDLEDLVAAFRYLAGMTRPPSGSGAERGFNVARQWGCFACHGPGGSGGLPNPGSFTGFIPGWYGADFGDLARNREEFDAWIRDGSIPRLRENPLASFFLRRQRIRMPAYRSLAAGDRDDLWAFFQWLEITGGGVREENATGGPGKP